MALVGGSDTTQTGENGSLAHEEQTRDAVTLITLHAAKGLEFPVVFLVGLEEGVLPHARSIESQRELEEERRIMYVGITRAADRLYLVRAVRRSFYGGNMNYQEPSRFLAEIPRELMVTTRQREHAGAIDRARGPDLCPARPAADREAAHHARATRPRLPAPPRLTSQRVFGR